MAPFSGTWQAVRQQQLEEEQINPGFLRTMTNQVLPTVVGSALTGALTRGLANAIPTPTETSQIGLQGAQTGLATSTTALNQDKLTELQQQRDEAAKIKASLAAISPDTGDVQLVQQPGQPTDTQAAVAAAQQGKRLVPVGQLTAEQQLNAGQNPTGKQRLGATVAMKQAEVGQKQQQAQWETIDRNASIVQKAYDAEEGRQVSTANNQRSTKATVNAAAIKAQAVQDSSLRSTLTDEYQTAAGAYKAHTLGGNVEAAQKDMDNLHAIVDKMNATGKFGKDPIPYADAPAYTPETKKALGDMLAKKGATGAGGAGGKPAPSPYTKVGAENPESNIMAFGTVKGAKAVLDGLKPEVDAANDPQSAIALSRQITMVKKMAAEELGEADVKKVSDLAQPYIDALAPKMRATTPQGGGAGAPAPAPSSAATYSGPEPKNPAELKAIVTQTPALLNTEWYAAQHARFTKGQ